MCKQITSAPFAPQSILSAFNDRKAPINQSLLCAMLSHKGTSFAQVSYVTQLKLAAKNKGIRAEKAVSANVQVFAGIKDYGLFRNQVLRSASKLAGEEVAEFQVSDTWHQHVDGLPFSIVQHKKETDKRYLYAIYNKSESAYFLDGKEATKEEVAALMTPSDAKRVLDDSETVYNKTNNVEHTVICRTIGLDSLVSITANGITVSV